MNQLYKKLWNLLELVIVTFASCCFALVAFVLYLLTLAIILLIANLPYIIFGACLGFVVYHLSTYL